jgi:hypothetical protein
VGSLYEALGYRVIRNIEVLGQQVDLLVEKRIPGLGLTRSVVECKYLSSGAVSNQQIFDHIHFMTKARQHAAITGSIIVSNRPFSLTAKNAAAESSDLVLKQLRDLENEIFNVTESLEVDPIRGTSLTSS